MGQVFRAYEEDTANHYWSLSSTYLTWRCLLLGVMLQLNIPKFRLHRVARSSGARLKIHEIGHLEQAPQPGCVGETRKGGQTGFARCRFRVDFRVHFRVNFQRYRLCYLTTVWCSENRPKAGKKHIFRGMLALCSHAAFMASSRQ